MKRQGRAFVLGDHINTDLIIGGRYCNLPSAKEMATHVFEDLDPDFVNRIEAGDMIVAGSNFGCGSSREEAPVTLKAAGISAIIAHSFARIFFRNCLNIGLPIFECPEAASAIAESSRVQVDTETGAIENRDSGACYQARAFPIFMRELIDRGGLVADARERLSSKGK